MRTDPRLRQTWNTISSNLESANESAQVNLFTFTQRYIQPCVSSVNSCMTSVTAPCFYSREERLRRTRGRGRGRNTRAEYSFDFYDDWDNDDFGAASDGLLNLGNDELDRLLAGGNAGATGMSGGQQPRRQRAMSYGARRDRPRLPGPPHDNEPDPTIIPSSSLFGLFGRLPFKLPGRGGKGLRYKPSAADLQDRSSKDHRRAGTEVEPLLEDHDDDDDDEDAGDGEQTKPGREGQKRRRRARSDTTGSESVSDSIRSRADLFPSDDEADAVPLDDEFAMGLERRMTTGSGTETLDSRGRDAKKGGRDKMSSRTSTQTRSSHETTSVMEKRQRRRSGSTEVSMDVDANVDVSVDVDVKTPSLADLKREEEAVQQQEEEEVERKRVAASRLAAKRGLSGDGQSENVRLFGSRNV